MVSTRAKPDQTQPQEEKETKTWRQGIVQVLRHRVGSNFFLLYRGWWSRMDGC